MNIIIVGCGRTGAMLAATLCKKGHDVAIIDINPEAFTRLSDDFRGRTLTGWGFDKNVLERADIKEADTVAAVTSDDLTNLLVAQIAKKYYNVSRVISRIFEPERAPLYDKLDISWISSVSWRVSRLEQLICHSTLSVLGTLGNGEVLIVDLLIPEELNGYTVKDLTNPGKWALSALVRKGPAQIVEPNLPVMTGDIVHMTVATQALDSLQEWLKEKSVEVEVCVL
ncbi:MAG: TrkA family potassium uptake protein [Anaerolineae bacterium]|nr:TrkA family potassium uptake protein [Anaerolineae bacterium]